MINGAKVTCRGCGTQWHVDEVLFWKKHGYGTECPFCNWDLDALAESLRAWRKLRRLREREE